MKNLEEKKKINLKKFILNFFISRNIFNEFFQNSNFLIDTFGQFCLIALEKKYTKFIYYDIGIILNLLNLEKNYKILNNFYRKKILIKFERLTKFFLVNVISNKIPKIKEMFKMLKKFYLQKKIYNYFKIDVKYITFKVIDFDKIYADLLTLRYQVKIILFASQI